MVLTNNNSVYITGLAHEYPAYSQTQEQFADLVTRLVPEYITSKGQVNHKDSARFKVIEC